MKAKDQAATTDDHAIQAAATARDAAEARVQQAYAALAAATPAGAGSAAVTLKVLQLRADVEQAEAERDAALRHVRDVVQARVDRLRAEYAPRRRVLLARLLELAEPTLAAARALREADEEIARATSLLPPEFPFPWLLAPDPLAPLRRMLAPPTNGEQGTT